MALTVVSRADWGSRPTTPTIDRDAKPEVFVHHVAGRVPTSLVDERAHMRELQAYALGGKGGKYPPGYYSDMDYNAVLGPSGVLYEGRGFFARSAATLDRNHLSRALVLMGNTDIREPTRAQLYALPEAIVYLIGIGSLVRQATIYGHYQNPAHPNATSCPGRFMVPHLPAVRAAVTSLTDPTPPLPQPSEDQAMHLAIRVPTNPNKAEALVVHDGTGISVIGFATPADRDVLVAAYKATPVLVTDAQYDDYIAHAAG